jgi:hypothetical protein
MTHDEAVERLQRMLKPGDTVQTILRHVSRSGMSRSISPVFNGEEISYLVGPALGMKYDQKNSGLKISGCGMDMGFSIVYDLGRELWPNGVPCIGEKCRSNDHSNGDRNYKPHLHKDSGYALHQTWL